MRTHSEQHRRRFCSKAKKPYTIRKLAQTQEPKKKKVPCDPSNVTGPEFEYPKTRRTKSKEEMKMTKKKKEKVKPFDRRRFLHQKPWAADIHWEGFKVLYWSNLG